MYTPHACNTSVLSSRSRRISPLFTKPDVVEKRLEKFELHDGEDKMLTFEAWWKTVEDDKVVGMQYPHECHGLASRPSNHTKKKGMMDFLEF